MSQSHVKDINLLLCSYELLNFTLCDSVTQESVIPSHYVLVVNFIKVASVFIDSIESFIIPYPYLE